MIWHTVVERVVDRHPIPVKLVRPGATENTTAELHVAAIQYQEQPDPTGGAVVQQTARWMIPARRLAALGFPAPPRAGDYLVFAGGTQRATVVSAGYSAGEVVRWDVTAEGTTR